MLVAGPGHDVGRSELADAFEGVPFGGLAEHVGAD
jgi:hypothetical protein